MLAEIVFCISASNSTVEKVFSTLTTLLSDHHLTMKCSTMEDCLAVAGNSSVWSESEKGEILDGAVKKYLKKKNQKNSYQQILKLNIIVNLWKTSHQFKTFPVFIQFL